MLTDGNKTPSDLWIGFMVFENLVSIWDSFFHLSMKGTQKVPLGSYYGVKNIQPNLELSEKGPPDIKLGANNRL